MRLYKIRCPQCLWRSPMPVDEEVAAEFRDKPCLNCREAGWPDVKFEVTEHIVVGPVQFFPHKSKGGQR